MRTTGRGPAPATASAPQVNTHTRRHRVQHAWRSARPDGPGPPARRPAGLGTAHQAPPVRRPVHRHADGALRTDPGLDQHPRQPRRPSRRVRDRTAAGRRRRPPPRPDRPRPPRPTGAAPRPIGARTPAPDHRSNRVLLAGIKSVDRRQLSRRIGGHRRQQPAGAARSSPRCRPRRTRRCRIRRAGRARGPAWPPPSAGSGCTRGW